MHQNAYKKANQYKHHENIVRNKHNRAEQPIRIVHGLKVNLAQNNLKTRLERLGYARKAGDSLMENQEHELIERQEYSQEHHPEINQLFAQSFDSLHENSQNFVVLE
jgi:hypothetical protein